MRIEVSNGEVIDKLTILEIKRERIQDAEKLKAIDQEIRSLEVVIKDYEIKNETLNTKYRKVLKYVNEQIWWRSDKVREMGKVDEGYSEIMHEIFRLNEVRYALKRKFDERSVIKEQKSYTPATLRIRLPEDAESIERVLGVVEYYSLTSDCKLLEEDSLVEKADLDLSKRESLIDLPKEIFQCYELWATAPRITGSARVGTTDYIVGGMLGDLIHSMYIPLIIYLTTGRKANIYVTDDKKYGGEPFTMGLEKTYKETYQILMAQSYISSYQILKDEPKEFINLSNWRTSPALYKAEWSALLSKFYKVPRYPIAHLSLPQMSSALCGTVCIHMALPKRLHLKPVVGFPIESIVDKNKCVFLTCNEAEYRHFISTYGVSLPLILCKDLLEIMTYISSCKFFVGNQSSPFAIAYSFHKPCLGSLTDPIFYANNDMYPDLFWWSSPESNKMDGISRYLKI